MKRFQITSFLIFFFCFSAVTAVISPAVFAQNVPGMNPDVMRNYQEFSPAGAGMPSAGGMMPGMDVFSEPEENYSRHDPVLTVTAGFTPPTETQPGFLFISAEIPDGWTIYSVTQKPGGPLRTKIQLPKTVTALSEPVAFPDGPRVKYEEEVWGPDFPVEYHTGKVQWRVPFRWTVSGAALTEISGSVYVQMCQEEICMDPRDFGFTARVIPGGEAPAAGNSPGGIQAGTGTAAQEMGVAPVKNPGAAVKTEETPAAAHETPVMKAGEPLSIPPAPERKRLTLMMAILFAFLGGLILNLMPCVLPVIGPKLFSFAKQAHESHWRVFQLNLMYSLGLLSVFWVLATLSKLREIFVFFGQFVPSAVSATAAVPESMAWGEQFTFPGFVIAMIALIFVMGLSFLGVWEIPIPGFVSGGRAGQMQKQEGLFGAFLMGILTTILATPCVGPFLGPVFGWALVQPVAVVYLVFTFIGLGLAAPYLLVGIFPAAVKWLPKPGEWMETLKEFMGFFFMGTVVYLFYILSPVYFVPTLGFMMGLWLACWMIGKVTYSGAGGESVLAVWAGGIMLAAGIGYLMFTFLGGPKAIIVSGPGAPDVMDVAMIGTDQEKIVWHAFSTEFVAREREAGKVVFIDFTANWCLTCKMNSVRVIETAATAKFLRERNITPVLADWTEPSPEIKAYITSLNRSAIPLIVIWTPGDEKPILLDSLITQKQLFDALQSAVDKKMIIDN